MLVPIVFIVALMVTLAGAMLENGLLAAKIALQTAVSRSSDVAIAGGVADFTSALAIYVQQHGTGGPWPQATSRSFPRTTCTPGLAAERCSFSYVIAGRITQASNGDAGPIGRDQVRNLQMAAIDEQRVSALVTATITSPAGTVLGTRTRALTFRVFAAPPYAVISGARDATTVNGVVGAAQGDSGGAPAQTGATTADAAHDTRIHVVLTCAKVIPGVAGGASELQAAGNDGLPWGNHAGAANETDCHDPPTAVDAFGDETWTNANAGGSGWTP